jgi:hypothetical protein
LPEQQQLRVAKDSLAKARQRGASRGRLRKLRRGVKKAQDSALVAETTRFGQARESWLRISASNRIKFKTFFQNSKAISDAWNSFTANLLAYLRLGVNLPPDERATIVESLEQYLEDLSEGKSPPEINWDLLRRDPRSYKGAENQEAFAGYERVGGLLTRKLDGLGDDIVSADSSVYMEEWLDLKD